MANAADSKPERGALATKSTGSSQTASTISELVLDNYKEATHHDRPVSAAEAGDRKKGNGKSAMERNKNTRARRHLTPTGTKSKAKSANGSKPSFDNSSLPFDEDSDAETNTKQTVKAESSTGSSPDASSDEDSTDLSSEPDSSYHSGMLSSKAVPWPSRHSSQDSEWLKLLLEAKDALTRLTEEREDKPRAKLQYQRLTEMVDQTTLNPKTVKTIVEEESKSDTDLFIVRRKHDGENKFINTFVEINSPSLSKALREILKDVKSLSLESTAPVIDPNILYHHLDDIRHFVNVTLKTRAKKAQGRTARRDIKHMAACCKVLIEYLEKDYAYLPLDTIQKRGHIEWEDVWVLFKPNCLAYTATYKSHEHPRCFKVDRVDKTCSIMRGQWWRVHGFYLEYNGKDFGLAEIEVHIDAFEGTRQITSLPVFPFHLHHDASSLKTRLVERGRRFVSLTGSHCLYHDGMAFEKTKDKVKRHILAGRVMVDPASFRRLNPNYNVSAISINPQDVLVSFSRTGTSDDGYSTGNAGGDSDGECVREEPQRFMSKAVYTDDGFNLVEVPVNKDGVEIKPDTMEALPCNAGGERIRSDEELMIASPVVLGFSLTEKLWLEFPLQEIDEIAWNDTAFDSLIIDPDDKELLEALVTTHKAHSNHMTDDIIRGKGKGLVIALHGPPGVGKTLTAEGVADLVRSPLWTIGAGELGTNPMQVEARLTSIMETARLWDAIVLLDEADVFLAQRESHDYTRNALVSVFLRRLEYFQGIIFLTTNRLTTIDTAFKSRIHMGLEYKPLSFNAKVSIWKMFIGRVAQNAKLDVASLDESDYRALAPPDLNGREIKNAVRDAEALAFAAHAKKTRQARKMMERGKQNGTTLVEEQQQHSVDSDKAMLTLEHLKRVIKVVTKFDDDMQGGSRHVESRSLYN